MLQGGPARSRSKLAPAGGALSVQLALTDGQSQKLEFARKNAVGWTLALRPVTDATDSAESLETLNTILCDGMLPAPTRSARGGRAR